jgi:hypothetical protein
MLFPILPDFLSHDWYKNVLWPERVPHLKGIPLWELNSYGALPMSAANKKVNRKVME